MKRIISLLAISLSASLSIAGTGDTGTADLPDHSQQATTSEVTPCSSLDSKSLAPAGTVCQTSSGFKFERVDLGNFGQAWKDQSGLVWSSFKGEATYSQADKICKDLGGSLPDKVDFQNANIQNIHEVLPKLGARWHWAQNLILEITEGQISANTYNAYPWARNINATSTRSANHLGVTCTIKLQ